jgi:hypothetical protein
MSRGLRPSPGEQQLPTDIGPEGHIEATPNTGISQAFGSLASDFGEVGSKVSQLADQATQVAGEKAGEDAGLNPEFKPTHDLTIYGRAFDQAGLNVYKTNVSQQMLNDMQNAALQHEGDPAALGQVLAQKRAGWLDNSLPDVRSELALSFDKQQFTLMREAVREQHNRLDAQNRASAEIEIQQSLRSIQQRAYSLGTDPQADGVLASDIVDLQNVLSRKGLNGAPLVNPEAAAKIVLSARDEVAQSRILGAFDRLPSTDAKEKFVRQFEEDFRNGTGVGASLGIQGFETMQRRLIAEMRQQRFLDNVQIREVSDRVKAARTMLEKGFSPPDDEMAALKAQAATITNPRMRTALDAAQADYEWQKTARTMTPQELSDYVNGQTSYLHENGGQPGDVHRLDLAQKLLGNMHSQLRQDAIGWATRVGFIQPQQLDFSDANKLTSSLQDRIPQAEQVAAHYGQQVQYFTGDERRALSTAIAQGGANSLALLGAINQAAGDRGRAMTQELTPGAPAMAALGAHVAETGITTAAIDAADGLALRKQKDAKTLTPLPKPAETEEGARRELSGVLDKDPSSKAALIDLANAVYQVRAARKGLDHFDSSTWRQGLRELIGERDMPDGTTYGGVVDQGIWNRNSILLPPYMKQSGWRDAIDMLTPDDLLTAGIGKPVGGDGKDISMDRLKNATLVQVGDGRFLMALGGGSLTPGAEQYARVGDGKKPLVLDFKKLAPVLSKRRPDLFLAQ